MNAERPIFQSEMVKVKFHIVEWTPAFPSQLIKLTMWFQHQGGRLLKCVQILVRVWEGVDPRDGRLLRQCVSQSDV